MILRETAYLPVALAGQYGSVRRLRRRQMQALDAILAHAVRRVPYYRDRPVYHRGRVRSVADFSELPVLTKAQVRGLPQSQFVADTVDPARCHHFSSSGTTGQRLAVLHDPGCHDYQTALSIRRLLATGRYLPTHRISQIRPMPADPRLVQRLGLFRRELLDSSEPVEQWKRQILRYRPHALVGYPVHVRELLRAMTGDDLAALRRSLRMVMTESELLVDEQRAAISAGFGVPVFDEYATYETLHIYFECAEGGRHIAEDFVHVEILDDRGAPVPDGVEGQIVCTSYRERGMPLLRYALGDLGMIETDRCPCGRRFRTMRLTKGRVNDSIVLPDGTRIFSDRFLALAMTHPGVAELFVRQDAAGAVGVHVVPDGTIPAPSVLADIHKVLEAEAGQDFDLRVLEVDRVPLTVGGKGRFVQSEHPDA